MSSHDITEVKPALKQLGLQVVQRANDQFEFYRTISQELYGSNNHPKSARKEIFEYENEKEFHYFQLFLTPRLPEKTYNEKTLKTILEEHVKEKQACPSERELFACAEKLKINIYVYFKTDEQSTWTWFRFAPILSDNDVNSNRYLMFLRYRLDNSTYGFVEIDNIQNKKIIFIPE